MYYKKSLLTSICDVKIPPFDGKIAYYNSRLFLLLDGVLRLDSKKRERWML